MKKITLAAAGALSLLLVGCAGQKKETVAECVFPDSPGNAAPLWVCDAPVEGVEVSAVGSATKSGAGYDFMKSMAAASARDQLARQMEVYVQSMIKRYAETTGAATAETVDMVNTSVSKQITKAKLSGSKVYRTITSPAGSVYTLVGLDAELAKKHAKAALNTSMKNDQAMWQQFKAKQGQDELAAEIANY